MNATFLTVRQYAKLEGVTHQTVYNRVTQGQVPAKKVLGRWLIITPPEKESAIKAGLKELVGSGARAVSPDEALST